MEDTDYLKHNKKLVFVVDMINGFLNEGNLADNKIKDIIPNIVELLKKYPAIFFKDSHDELASEFSHFPIHCVKNTFESEIVVELQPYANQIIEKNSTNGFHVLDVKMLEAYDEFIICGCCSDICVLHFALSLKTYLDQFNIDKKINVYENSIATFNTETHPAPEYQKMALSIMKLAGINIL